MPRLPKHCVACWMLFGKTYSWLHRAMDEGANKHGKKHRDHEITGYHTLKDLIFLIYYNKYEHEQQKWIETPTIDLLKAGIIHIIQDERFKGLEKIEHELTEAVRKEEGDFYLTTPQIEVFDLKENWPNELAEMLLDFFHFSLYSNEKGIKFLNIDTERFNLFLDCTYHWGGRDDNLEKRIYHIIQGKEAYHWNIYSWTYREYGTYERTDVRCLLSANEICTAFCKGYG
ncbi:MAG: hypothetical protein ACFFD4_38640 [Candidatus Odinarchaeota archaeon]